MRSIVLAALALSGIACSSTAVRDVAEVAAMSGGPVGSVLGPIVEWRSSKMELSEADAWQAKHLQLYAMKLQELQMRNPREDARTLYLQSGESFLLLAPNHRFYLGIEQVPRPDTLAFYKNKIEEDALLSEVQTSVRWHQDHLLGSDIALRRCFDRAAQHYTAEFNREMGRLSAYYTTHARFIERTFTKPNCEHELLDFQISQFD